MLKEWLTRALAVALEEGATTLTPHHLARQAEPARKLLSLAREIQEGEEGVRAGGRERADVRRLLGLPFEPIPRAAASGGASTPSRRPGSRVAERLPSRDPVGGTEHAG